MKKQISKRRPTIRILDFTISLFKGTEWVARKNGRIIDRDEDWVLLMRRLGLKNSN